MMAVGFVLLLNGSGANASGPTFVTLHTFNSYGDGWTPASYDARLLLGSDSNYYGTTTVGGTNGVGTVFQVTSAGVYKTLHSFTGSTTPPDGSSPNGHLIEDPTSGYLYGTTQAGGANSYGTIFKIAKDGTGYSVVYSFAYSTDGAYPYAGLVESSSVLYGVTSQGGANSNGTIFKINASGGTLTDLHDFAGSGSDGSQFYTSLVIIKSALYGSARAGGANYGTIFTIGTGGTGFSVLHSFAGGATEGGTPGGVCDGGNGMLYFTVANGTTNGYGALESIPTTGGAPTVLKSFANATDGYNAEGEVVSNGSGSFYGATEYGGTDSTDASGSGVIFKYVTATSTFSDLTTFLGDSSEGASGQPGPIIGSDGSLYGVRGTGSVLSDGTIWKASTSVSTSPTVIYSFGDGFFDGRTPDYGSLAFGPDQKFYGTTTAGGAYSNGIVYQMALNGTYQIAHEFNGQNLLEGSMPQSGLVVAPSGLLYGTTSGGGTYSEGTVYSISTAFDFTPIFDFGEAAGSNVPSNLVYGTDGNLYGTTLYGGQYNDGAVIRMAPDGSDETVLHSFNGTDGENPNAGLIQASDGNFYGTARTNTAGFGNVFEYSPTTGFSIVHAFKGSDGSQPSGGVIEGFDGTLYGMTSSGGSDYGVIYKVAKTGGSTFHDMDDFDYTTRGATPYGSLVQGSTGTLYGTAYQGGPNAGGTIFQVGTGGGNSFFVLNSLPVTGSTGASPKGSLVEGIDGNIYGTTSVGGVTPTSEAGADIMGSVFRVQIHSPIINSFSPTSAAPGASITINGSNFAGVTSVSFNGTAATPTSFTATTITVKVPTGATTGQVQVTEVLGGNTVIVYSFKPFTVT